MYGQRQYDANMKTKLKKFQMRLSEQEYQALMKLADRDGIKMSAYLLNYVRAQAHKKGIPI